MRSCFPSVMRRLQISLALNKRKVLVVDIGSWTIDMMPVVDERAGRAQMLYVAERVDYLYAIHQ